VKFPCNEFDSTHQPKQATQCGLKTLFLAPNHSNISHPPKKIEHVQFATENKISPKFEASFLLGPFYTAIFLDKKPFEWKAALHVTRPIKAGRGAPWFPRLQSHCSPETASAGLGSTSTPRPRPAGFHVLMHFIPMKASQKRGDLILKAMKNHISQMLHV
jgi:hypothetical protein